MELADLIEKLRDIGSTYVKNHSSFLTSLMHSNQDTATKLSSIATRIGRTDSISVQETMLLTELSRIFISVAKSGELLPEVKNALCEYPPFKTDLENSFKTAPLTPKNMEQAIQRLITFVATNTIDRSGSDDPLGEKSAPGPSR